MSETEAIWQLVETMRRLNEECAAMAADFRKIRESVEGREWVRGMVPEEFLP